MWASSYSKRCCDLLLVGCRRRPDGLLFCRLKCLAVSRLHDKVATLVSRTRARISVTWLWRLRTLTRRVAGTSRQTVTARNTGTHWRRLRTAIITGLLSYKHTHSHHAMWQTDRQTDRHIGVYRRHNGTTIMTGRVSYTHIHHATLRKHVKICRIRRNQHSPECKHTRRQCLLWLVTLTSWPQNKWVSRT